MMASVFSESNSNNRYRKASVNAPSTQAKIPFSTVVLVRAEFSTLVPKLPFGCFAVIFLKYSININIYICMSTYSYKHTYTISL
jgi:hypothetical protein